MGEDGGDVVAGVDGAAPVEEVGGQADGQQLGEALADVPVVDGVRMYISECLGWSRPTSRSKRLVEEAFDMKGLSPFGFPTQTTKEGILSQNS